MNKVCLFAMLLLLFGCGGKNVQYKIEKDDLKIISTKEYLIIERCVGANNFGVPIWEFKETIRKRDRYGCFELMDSLCRK